MDIEVGGVGSWSRIPHFISRGDKSRVVLGKLQFWTWTDPGDIINVDIVASSADQREGFWSETDRVEWLLV